MLGIGSKSWNELCLLQGERLLQNNHFSLLFPLLSISVNCPCVVSSDKFTRTFPVLLAVGFQFCRGTRIKVTCFLDSLCHFVFENKVNSWNKCSERRPLSSTITILGGESGQRGKAKWWLGNSNVNERDGRRTKWQSSNVLRRPSLRSALLGLVASVPDRRFQLIIPFNAP